MKKIKGIYRKIKKSVLAFTYPGGNLECPNIIGTGFVVREDGILATNLHVVEGIEGYRKYCRLPKKRFPVGARIYVPLSEGMVETDLEILRWYFPFDNEENPPDLAFIQVKAKGLPKLTIDTITFMEEGIEVGTTGFPLGQKGLKGAGAYQATPTLQKGIIGAVQSYPCEKPLSFSIDIMSERGSSGSPVFSWETGRVLGVLYGGLPTHVEKRSGRIGKYTRATSISYAVPSHYITTGLKKLKASETKLPPDTQALKDIVDEEYVEAYIKNLEEK